MSTNTLAASDIISSPVFAVSPRDIVAHAPNLMVRHKISRVLVMDEGKLPGKLTKKDIGYRLHHQGAVWRRRFSDQNRVAEYDMRDPVSATPLISPLVIARIFITKKIGSVPVIDNGIVVGIVTKEDLMKSALVTGLRGTIQDVTEDAVTAVALMQCEQVNNLVVVEHNALAGILKSDDIIKEVAK
ncbi:MAG: CBS domain-containing protein [Methanoregula sp.]|uniref:CBS domain-containing protein n=1 Tax=Methanoregula sp. TaxID=2052170 RepID=UPI003BB1410C